jgi:hypothetical protein
MGLQEDASFSRTIMHKMQNWSFCALSRAEAAKQCATQAASTERQAGLHAGRAWRLTRARHLQHDAYQNHLRSMTPQSHAWQS